MNEITKIAIAAAVNLIVWISFFRWITKPERERRYREKLMRNEE